MNKKEPIPIKIKERILKLFDYKCFFCDKDLSKNSFLDIQIHHFTPESSGGKMDEQNLVCCCYNCHRRLHSKIIYEYWQVRKILYNLFCYILEICPVDYGWDDDLYALKKEINKENIDLNWKKLHFLMRFIDENLGKIDVQIKIKDLIDFKKFKEIIKPKKITDYLIFEQTLHQFISETKKKEKSND